MAIENRIPILLAERRWTRRKLAEEAGINYETAVRLYKGDTNSINFAVLNSLCKTLDVQVGDIFAYVPDDK